MQERLPSFLGLGTQKGGTTTLQAMLQQHPGVYLPAEKEVQFFTLHFGAGLRWYGERFLAAGPTQRCGEITPYYLFHPVVPRRIRELLPAARLIVLVRDPVERCLSGLFHSQRLGLEPLPLEAALAAEPGRLAGAEAALAAPDGRHHSHQVHSYLSRSRYELQLARYEQLFPPEQLLLLRSEDLFVDPEPLWRRVLAFLELAACPLPAAVGRRNAGAGEAEAVDPALRLRLRQQLAPTYQAMERRYGLQW
ncbi:MAG: sulfotransferase [Cyanobacteriota bacterium]|nr:sulfotransferase [Cyanobacteriota bacterium]